MNKLGTHNSMSYLPLRNWYYYPFRFIGKCQNVDINKQYNLGSRMFDLRVRFIKGEPVFAHGLISFKGSVLDTLEVLNNKYEKVYVRFILEVLKEDAEQEALFKQLCAEAESKYSNLRFICGRRKFDWEQIYTFKYKEPVINQEISSIKSNGIWPWYYAKKHNKETLENRNKLKWTLIDFIDIE